MKGACGRCGVIIPASGARNNEGDIVVFESGEAFRFAGTGNIVTQVDRRSVAIPQLDFRQWDSAEMASRMMYLGTAEILVDDDQLVFEY